MIDNKAYIKFLVENMMGKIEYEYAISNSIDSLIPDGPEVNYSSDSYPVQRMKQISNEMQIVRYEIGLNARVPVNTRIIEINTRSVLIEFEILGLIWEKRIYCHTGVSPDEFYNRIMNTIDEKLGGMRTGDFMFDVFESFYKDYKTNFAKLFFRNSNGM